MPSVDIVIDYKPSRSIRCQQLEAIFDVPPQEKCRLRWSGELPLEARQWDVGLIVGPSGCGKTTIAKKIFKDNYSAEFTWKAKAVIDDFNKKHSIEEITKVCQAVGFNTVPAWLRPYRVLSTGEKFRVDIARRLLEAQSPIVVDEFTSVVDRQVAKIGAHAVQKFVRRNGKQFVAVSCHYDIIDWLMPDWIFEPATMAFKWLPRGSLQRPKIEVEIRKVDYELWRLFAPFHYLTQELFKAARCFALFVAGQPVSFIAVLHIPNPSPKAHNIKRVSRVVTLPDWQGLGLVFVLTETIAAAYKALGYRLRIYPAHPPLIRAVMKSKKWKLTKKPGFIQKTKLGVHAKYNPHKTSRPCATFEYIGKPMDKATAQKLINGD